jgi:1,4-alpha-glucan branching enzyme
VVSRAQIVTTNPTIPIESQPVSIIFDATQGTAGLAGFTGDVYAHTGVITDKSTSGSDWKYVKTNWGQNTQETKLTRIGNDLYELNIVPSIRTYYGVPSNEIILQIAFVFRSADSSLEGKDDGGKDIFVDVFAAGFIVQIDQPEDNTILVPGETLNISVSTTQEADIELAINDVVVAEASGTTLEFENQFTDPGDYWLVAIANNGEENTEDTLFVCVKEEVVTEALPAGLRRGVNYIEEDSVVMVLFAPEKEFVFALGEFNQWRPRNDFQMKQDGDYFWLGIGDLWPDYPYVYQYLIDGALLLADPYTDQVSDPFNDKYISNTTYPGLVEYPFSKTTGMASVFTTGQDPYPWEVTEFTPVEKEKLVIYELLIRDFDERHSYDAVIDRLDYLENLGINALELMPVNEFEGNISWGYNPSFYFAPDKYYGPKNELKRLIDECHKRGIAVIIDMVLNHSYSQSPFVQMYIENGKPAANNPWYNVDHNFTNPDAQWGFDFNHESIHTQELVDSINSYWMKEYKVDGFRFDFTKGFGNNLKGGSDLWASNYDADRIRLLKRMSDEIWERNPNALVIFEHLAENSEETELAEYGIFLWGNMHYDYKEAAMGYNSNLNWGVYKNRGWSEPQLVTYMESHDEQRIMYEISQYGNSSGDYDTKDPVYGAHRIGLNAVFFLPLPGPKMIWQFGELGYDVSIDYDCRVCEKPILWEYFEVWQRRNIYDIMSNLNYLKTNYEIFSTDDVTTWLSGNVKQYRLANDGEFVMAVGNFDVVGRGSTVNLPVTGTWYEYFSRNSFEATETQHHVTLEPGEYRLYSTQEFDWKTDMSPVNTEEPGGTRSFQEFGVFPNPAENMIQWKIELVKHQVFDVLGNLVLETRSEGDSKMDISFLPAGNYISLAIDENGEYRYAKWIKK